MHIRQPRNHLHDANSCEQILAYEVLAWLNMHFKMGDLKKG